MARDPLIVGKVIGEVLDYFTPSVNMTISYNKKQIFNGYEFFPSAVSNRPRVQIDGPDLRSFYTLVCLTSFLSILFFSSFSFLTHTHISSSQCYLLWKSLRCCLYTVYVTAGDDWPGRPWPQWSLSQRTLALVIPFSANWSQNLFLFTLFG